MKQWRLTPLLTALLALLLSTSRASAHVQLQGSSLDVVVHRDRVTITANLTGPEIPVDDSLPPGSTVKQEELENYGYFLTAHLQVTATGGERLAGHFIKAVAADSPSKRSVCELEYRSDSTPPVPIWKERKPAGIELRSTVMEGRDDLREINVQGVVYAVRISVEGGKTRDGLLLSDDNPVDFSFEQGGGVFGPYLLHGIRHILTGYDHLLFVTALVLAAATLWDLIKVVSVFTIAHTLTLCLSALDVCRLPGYVVEPFIAGSIVFVAVQNVLWPKQARGAGRLLVAFFFGLFHGLGFAGGLLDAMQGMSGGVAVLAIAAFSLGVEIGHQMVVLPLYTFLTAVRRERPGDSASADRMSRLVTRAGSALVALAGAYYFAAALNLVRAIGD